MLDKYFGFLKVIDEYSVMESLIEHANMDEKEITFLEKMLDDLIKGNLKQIPETYTSVRNMTKESIKIFEKIPEQIITANFDSQKQYDLLRLFQRIESISNYIVATAKRFLIVSKIEAKLPKSIEDNTQLMLEQIKSVHDLFKQALSTYQEDKKATITLVEDIVRAEKNINHTRGEILENLYREANEGNLKMGNLRAIENLIEHLEDIADTIAEAGTSLDWLLIY